MATHTSSRPPTCLPSSLAGHSTPRRLDADGSPRVMATAVTVRAAGLVSRPLAGRLAACSVLPGGPKPQVSGLLVTAPLALAVPRREPVCSLEASFGVPCARSSTDRALDYGSRG